MNLGAGPAKSSNLSFKVGGESDPPTFPIPALVAGEIHIVQRNEVLGVAQNYLVTVEVDTNDAVIECNELNNKKTDAFTVSMAPLTFIRPPVTLITGEKIITAIIRLSPDLVVDSLTHTPIRPTTADEITFTATVKNIGAGSSSPAVLSFQVGGETYPPTFLVPELAPGETYTIERKLILGIAQSYLVTAIIDINDDVTESSEENNKATDKFIVVQS